MQEPEFLKELAVYTTLHESGVSFISILFLSFLWKIPAISTLKFQYIACLEI